ncbi:MAG: hypothetical protein HW421_3097 [Ignavibacteria bacterium]|nr:hypothetical protein [Ignavibacteria bacterium]
MKMLFMQVQESPEPIQQGIPAFDTVLKILKIEECHSERSEESRNRIGTGFFTSFRMTFFLTFHTYSFPGMVKYIIFETNATFFKTHFRIVLFLFLFIFVSNTRISAQGFDWQYSARMPAPSPILFAGVKASIGYTYNNGSFNFAEDVICTNFNNGDGSSWNVGIAAEYWHSGNYAFFAGLSYARTNSSFKNAESYPTLTNQLLLEYNFNLQQQLLDLEFGIKRRILETHFSTIFSLSTQYSFTISPVYTQNILSPPEIHFSTGNPYKRNMQSSKTPPIRQVNLIPQIKLGYDFQVGLGTYSSIWIGAGLPILSVTSEGDWHRWYFSAGLCIYKGVFSKY